VADAGGVEFLMELNAKFDEATKMLREMTKVETESAKLAASMAHAGKSTSLLTDGMHKVKESFKSVGEGVFGEFGKEFASHVLSQFTALASFEGFKRLTEGLIDLGKEGLKTAGEAERTRKSFEFLMGVQPADELLGFMDRLAGKTEFTDGQLKGFAVSLVRAGFSGEAFNRALAATIDLAALSQDKLGGAAEAVALLNKVQLKGGITERELVTAGLSPKKVFTRIAGELGIGLKAAEDQLSAGKVKTTTILEALYSELAAKTGKPLGGAGIALSSTFLAKIEKTKDLIPNLFEELEHAGGLKTLTAGLGHLVETFDPDAPAGRKIVKGLTGLLDHFGELVSKVDFDVWAGRLENAMGILEVVLDIGAGLAHDIGHVFDGLTSLGDWLGDSLFDLATFVGDFYDSALELGTAVWEGIKYGIEGGLNFVVGAVRGLGGAIVDTAKGVLGIHSPSAVFADFGENTAAGFEKGINDSLPGVARTVADAFGPAALLPPVPTAAALPPLGASAGAADGAGVAGPRMHANITINVGAAAGAGEREMAEHIGVSVRQALESLLAQMGAERGAA
jgi:hypothetical protein